MKVKICGLMDSPAALAAAQVGADYLGLVFAPGRRQLNPDQAKAIADSLGQLKTRPQLVGVFLDTSPAEINQIAAYCGLDLVQLSGKQSWYQSGQINLPVIKVLHIGPDTTSAEVMAQLEKGYGWIDRGRLTFLLDTESSQGGGSGRSFDWEIAREVAAHFPVMVAGGLNPENLAAMLSQVKPWGVDVSSGVETEGLKDLKKIEYFIKTAKLGAGQG